MTYEEDLDGFGGIAVIGMAARLPGAPDVATFWRNLRDGVESISTFTDAALRSAGIDPVRLAQPNYVRAGGTLEGVDLFDSEFFGFSPREASIMDPQFRLFLESCQLALDSAGHDPSGYPGAIGVYGGMSYGKYLIHNLLPNRELLQSAGDLQLRIFNDKDFLASLVAYKLDLTGPSLSVQTACSTSLVAVCLACQGLLHHQCDMALAGGVSVSVPTPFGYHAIDGVFSPDGHCRAFDAGATGTVQGNGVGVVVLKRLEDAVADGDRVRAVIRGFALNNDGAGKAGYTAPSVEGQAEAIAMAHAVAGVEPETIGYIEAHGTGTPLGDPIELTALNEVFRQSTDRVGFCAVGSVKTNIGHLDAAAGVASLVKTVLALEHGELPPTLNFERPNPRIPFDGSPFYPNDRLRRWPAEGHPRRAGVSAFAVGGVNAHLVVEQAPPPAPSTPAGEWQLLVLSARSDTALDRTTENLADHLRARDGEELADVAFTLQTGRRRFEHRRALVCRTTGEAAALLSDPGSSRVFTRTEESRDRPVVFLFPGLGNHYVDMGRELYSSHPVFRREVDHCCELLRDHLDADLRTLLYPERDGEPAPAEGGGEDLVLRRMLGRGAGGKEAGPLRDTAVAQPALFVVEYALAQLWLSWGVRPESLAGYSIGEYAAACVAGVMRVEDALRLVARRARRIAELPGGSMLAVALPEAEVADRIAGTQIAVSALTGPAATVVGGPVEEVGALAEELRRDGVTCQVLPTTHAFHTPMLDPVVDGFAELLVGVELRPPEIPLIANATGRWMTDDEATSPEYWARHLVRPVRFGDALTELWREPERLFLEVGPGQALSSWALQHPDASPERSVVAVSLPHAADDQPSSARVLEALGRLWAGGAAVDWRRVHGEEHRLRVELPGYPFERRRHWVEPPAQGGTTPAPVPPEADRRPLDEWFYVPVWRQTPLPSPATTHATGEREPWLLFCDGSGLGDRLAEAAEATGRRCLRVREGERYEERDGEVVVRPAAPEDYRSLLRHASVDGALPGRIVHLWTVTGGGRPVSVLQDLGFLSLLHLAQALGERGVGEGTEIVVVSDRLQRIVPGDPVEPEKGTVLGPVRVLPQEYPGLGCRSIDVGQVDDGAAERLLPEILAGPGPAVLAHRGATRWVRDHEPAPLAAVPAGAGLREGGVYLITGGLGGVGATLARHLAETARARLVLVGRTELPPAEERRARLAAEGPESELGRRLRALEEIEALGVEVLALSADVTDREAMEGVRGRLRERFGAGVAGIVHAAGTPPGGMAQLKERTAADAVLAPKLRGTRVLAEVFAEDRPDFVLLCSSLTSQTGAFGLIDHAAANAFLDQWAQAAFSGAGSAVVSVNWDTWLEVGQAARAAEGFSRKAQLRAAEPPSDPGATPELAGEPVDHPLLDRRLPAGEAGEVFVSDLAAEGRWILDEHRVLGDPVLPGVGFLEMALAAHSAVRGGDGGGPGDALLEGVDFLQPLRLRDGETLRVRTTLTPAGAGHSFSVTGPDGTCHARGKIAPTSGEAAPEHDLDGIRRRCTEREIVHFEEHVDGPDGAAPRFRFGPRWRGVLQRVHLGRGEALATLELDEAFAGDLEDYRLHPALVDTAVGYLLVFADGEYLPVGYERVEVRRRLPRRLHCWARFRTGGEAAASATRVLDAVLLDDRGRELVTVRGYTARRVEADAAPATDAAVAELLGGHLGETLGGVAGRHGADPTPRSGVARLYSQGLTPAEGVQVLDRLLGHLGRAPQWIVSTRELTGVLQRAAASHDARTLQELGTLQTAAGGRASASRTPFLAPRNEMEHRLVRLWSELLGIERIGVHDSFFDLGGDSLLATQLIARIGELFDVEVSLHRLFQAPTPAEMAVVVVGSAAESVDEDVLADALDEIRGLSPDELERTLAAERGEGSAG